MIWVLGCVVFGALALFIFGAFALSGRDEHLH